MIRKALGVEDGMILEHYARRIPWAGSSYESFNGLGLTCISHVQSCHSPPPTLIVLTAHR